MDKQAIVIGATGLVGDALIQGLLLNKEFTKICIVVRSTVKKYIGHKKVTQIVMEDFLDLNYEHVQGFSHAFSCLGTTIKKAGSKDNFYKIDYEINAHFAMLFSKPVSDQNTHFLIVSALGAKDTSMIFYNRVKGRLEQYLTHLELYKLSIFQPSLLLGQRQEKRSLEKLAQEVFLKVDQYFPKPFLYKPVAADQLAYCMIVAANAQMEKIHIYDNLEIQTQI